MQEEIQKYIEYSEKISDLRDELEAQVEWSNLALSDLDHYLELEVLDNEERDLIVTKRHSILIARRKSKDYIRVIDHILPKQIEGRKTRDRYEFAIRQLDARVYSPRSLSLREVIDRDPIDENIGEELRSP